MSRKVELYEHDDDLCARGCGKGCSRNTYAVGWSEARQYDADQRDAHAAKLRAQLADARKRIRLARKAFIQEPFQTVDDRDAALELLDLRRPLRGQKGEPR